MPAPAAFDNFPAALKERLPYGPYRGVVQRWLDGDTVEALLDCGVDEYPCEALRLADLWAAELDAPDPPVRALALAQWRMAARLFPVGTPVLVATELNTKGNERRSFTRYVARLETADGRDVVEALKMIYLTLEEAA